MKTLELSPAEIALGISEGFRNFIQTEEHRERSTKPRDYVYASSWRACTRQMALEMMHPEMLPDWSADTLANFRRGKDRERDLLADFTRAGRNSDPSFEVIGREQRFEIVDHKGRVAIVGKVDARLKVGRHSMPMEVKSWNANIVARIETFEDLFANRWTRSGAHQLLAYMFATDEPVGFFLLDRNGLPILLPVELEQHLDRMEDFLSRAERALDAQEIGEIGLPAFHGDAVECRYCPFFGSICNPPSYSPGADLIVDEETIRKVERYADIQAIGDECADLEKEIKKRFRGTDMAVVGKTLIEGKWKPGVRYDLTDEAKAQIETIKKPFARKVPDYAYQMTVTKI